MNKEQERSLTFISHVFIGFMSSCWNFHSDDRPRPKTLACRLLVHRNMYRSAHHANPPRDESICAPTLRY
jgi:hypothetical protein